MLVTLPNNFKKLPPTPRAIAWLPDSFFFMSLSRTWVNNGTSAHHSVTLGLVRLRHGRGTIEHAVHVRHLARIPRADVLIEGRGIREHATHVTCP